MFMGRANYSEEFEKIHNLSIAFAEQKHILKVVDSWTHGFIQYTQRAEKVDMLHDNVTEEKFQDYLASYLWSPSGARFQKNFRFDGELVCGQPAPLIEVSSWVHFILEPPHTFTFNITQQTKISESQTYCADLVNV